MVNRPIQHIISGFGPRIRNGVSEFHYGIDLRTWDLVKSIRQDVVFPEDATVSRVIQDPKWGGIIVLKPLDEDWNELKFMHLDLNPNLTTGNTFLKGTYIGQSMQTEYMKEVNSAEHTHFEAWRDGKAQDGKIYLTEKGYDYE